MPFLAAADTQTLTNRLGQIPPEFWLKLLLGVVVLVVAVVLLRKLARLNKVVLTVAVLLVLSFLGFNWIYERSEPAWATPVVHWLAQYFPSKGVPTKR